jgi:hypothetical protein
MTVMLVTLAFSTLAKRTPCSTAFMDNSEPSVGMRMCLYMTLRSDPCIISFQNMPLVVRCQRKIFIAIAADEPMHTVMGAVIAAPAQFPQSVTFCTWILRPLVPLRGTITGSDSASVFSPTDRLPIWVTVLWCAGASRWFGLANARPIRQSQFRNLVIGWMSMLAGSFREERSEHRL